MRELLRLAASVAGVVALATTAAAVLPDDIAPGTRVEVEGRIDSGGRIVAKEVELESTPSGIDGLEGRIDALGAGADATRRLRVAGVEVVLEPDALVRDGDGDALDLRAMSIGQRAELEGQFVEGVLRARALEVEDMKPGKADRVQLRGIITEVDGRDDTFQLLGVEVAVASETKVEFD
ncbi:MAG: DUF5666 domain-containing protein [Myxococcota bacterium]